jgi:DNA-binding MarR family transcriptional regulator
MLDLIFPDHIGWLLWQASQSWHRDFVSAMQQSGHPWFTEARSTLLGNIAPKGTRQGLLVEKLGISKQAVQQLLDGLELDGILERVADPLDKRGRIVRLTDKGRVAMSDANQIKLAIENDYRTLLGDAQFTMLADILRKLQRSG